MSELKSSHQAAQQLTSKLLLENKKRADTLLKGVLDQLNRTQVSSVSIIKNIVNVR